MNKKNIGKAVLIIGAIILTGGLYFFLKSKNDVQSSVPEAEPETSAATKTKTASGEILIQNYDAVWDYKFSNNRWFTKKKESDTWLDMKESLSADQYALAIKRLSDFINKK